MVRLQDTAKGMILHRYRSTASASVSLAPQIVVLGRRDQVARKGLEAFMTPYKDREAGLPS